MAKNLISGPILGFEFYLYYLLSTVPSYHPMQFNGKLMNQTWQNGKIPNF